MSAAIDVGTDDGLRHALRQIDRARSWDLPVGRELLTEIRRHAVRNAARVSATTGAAADRGLADDVLSAAWTVLHRHAAEVMNADRPWAYLMYSAQRQVAADAKAQQLLTSAERGPRPRPTPAAATHTTGRGSCGRAGRRIPPRAERPERRQRAAAGRSPRHATPPGPAGGAPDNPADGTRAVVLGNHRAPRRPRCRQGRDHRCGRSPGRPVHDQRGWAVGARSTT